MVDPNTPFFILERFLNSGWYVFFQIIGGLISAFLLVMIIYLTYKNGNIARQLRHLWIAWNSSSLPPSVFSRRWKKIQAKISGDNPQEWKEAIWECDFLLDQILKRLGYEGSTTEERLNKALPEQFPALDDAWKAHQVSDFLAEDPSYALTREALDKTMEIYEMVFRETGLTL